jgi:hypothetical protein
MRFLVPDSSVPVDGRQSVGRPNERDDEAAIVVNVERLETPDTAGDKS